MYSLKQVIIIVLISIFTVAPIYGKNNDQGFIYGKVITLSGETYKGIMRWGKQEYSWDDLFNATKEVNPWTKHTKGQKDRNISEIKVLGKTIITLNGSCGTLHQFVTRFGDIAVIEIDGDDEPTLKMKNGTEYKVSGYGDVEATIRILDENLGKVKLDWERIKRIEFMPTPEKVKKEGYRLCGKLITDDMTFEGYIMWDAEECISTDILDGETFDGDVEIEFGNIRSIKRRSSSSCMVILKDGREFTLRGTNDVDDDNRGIYIEDKRYGKVEVQWDEFKEVVFNDEGDSGDPYNAYEPTGRLKGIVTIHKGDRYEGEIVFDLDESEGFEILDGKKGDMDFYIPFRHIVSITPKGRHASLVKLINGEEILLEDTQDVSECNDGVLVFQKKDDTIYVEWGDIEKIEFHSER